MVRLVSWVRFPQRARPRTSSPGRRSSVGQSIRLIIGRSSVRSRSPLPPTQTVSPPERRHSKHHEQGEVRAHQAAREHRDDGSHRPRQDHVDGGDLEDPGRPRPRRVHAVRLDRQGAGGEGPRHHDLDRPHRVRDAEPALRARRHARSRRLHQEHDHRRRPGRRGDPRRRGHRWSDAPDPGARAAGPPGRRPLHHRRPQQGRHGRRRGAPRPRRARGPRAAHRVRVPR